MNTNKKNNKAIALVYTKPNYQPFLFLLSVVLGLSLALLPGQSKAQATITYDVKSNAPIDYAEVDKFNRASNTQATKFAVQDGELILSDKPIKLAKKYQVKPSQLVDLGKQIYSMVPPATPTIAAEAAPPVTEVAPQVAEVSAPVSAVTPPMESPVTKVEAPAASTPVSVAAIGPEPVHLAPVAPAPLTDNTFWAIFGGGLIVLAGLLLLIKTRRVAQPEQPVIRSEKITTTNMVGQGNLFDFNGKVVKGPITPINTTFLNMLWRVGKFSQEGSMSTYFYMTFYIPPQQGYAKSLKKTVKVKEEEKHMDS